MKYRLLFLFLAFSFTVQGQCFDCAKNFGGWVDDVITDFKKTDSAIFLTILSDLPGVYKYDYNCNLIWKKDFGNFASAYKVTIDDLGNLYVLVDCSLNGNYNYGQEPFYMDGLELFLGLNLYKLSPNGDIIWNRKIGVTNQLSKNIFFSQGSVYVTGTFNNSININNQISLIDSAYYGRAFIAKFDTNGNLLDAQKYGSGDDIFMTSEIDTHGNIYFARKDPNITYSSIDKINSNLQVVWKKEISNNGNIANATAYRPTILHYNALNDKLYLWGCFDRTINILGNTFTTNSTSNSFLQSILTEFSTSDGSLEHFKQFNNNSLLESPEQANSRPHLLNKSFIVEKNNELFILSSFSGTMEFPNKTIKSSTYNGGGGPNDLYNNEELVLFKIDLTTFDPKFILKSYGKSYYSNGQSVDATGPILFNGTDLYLTSNFQSSPLTINNTIINNNSGNNSTDVMLYKYKLDASTATGEIIAENTCFNTLTNFNVNGTFDSIAWDFDDPNSSSNSAIINNPTHQFSAEGTYHVKVIVNCGSDSQTLEKDITITNTPTINALNSIYSCETIPGSGISNSFDTSNINSTIVGSQTNLVVEYIDSNGNLLPSPLPNPYTNTIKKEETIKVKSYFQNNPYCFVETNLKLYTLSKPLAPSTTSPQNFCIQENATLNDITITGQNIKWYDTLAAGTLLSNTTSLQNGNTYYASQIINGCESERIPVLVNIQNTPAPTGVATQSFCSSQNPTLNTIEVVGTTIKWYDRATFGNLLTDTTPLVDGNTYYATQTENNCESNSRLAVTVSIISSLPATDYSELFCDDINDGRKIANLSDYNFKLIATNATYNFTYYTSSQGAENELTADQISNFSNYNLVLGDNKIYVRINSNTPCFAITELNLTLVSKPIISIPDVVPICENNTVIIDAGAGFDSYLWSTGATTAFIIVTNPGNFDVTVTNNFSTISCSSTKTFTVKNSTIATINTIETKDWTDTENMITVHVTGAGDFEYSIDGIHFQDSNQFLNVHSGEYTVHVRDKNGCGTVTDEIYLLMYPKFFTPNGDGYNDTWKIKFSDLETSMIIKIFDRYGKLLKELTQNNSWDGTFNGQELPSTDYWFAVTRNNGKEYKGHFSLKK